jgi:hypothetical protein
VTAETDPIAEIPAHDLQRLYEIADRLIPAAHGMPSAGDVLTAERLRFVFNARPDLIASVRDVLRLKFQGTVDEHIDVLSRFHQEHYAALQLVIVGGYYTDKRVRELIGYNGQEAIEVKSWLLPPYLEEGLIDKVLERGPVWRDPATGKRAVVANAPRTYAQRFAATAPQGGLDGRDGA